VILIAISTIVELLQDGWGVSDNLLLDIIQLIGDSPTALLISGLIAGYPMCIARNIPVKQVMNSADESIKSIGMMLLIIGGGGVFKQVLIDGGVGDSVANIFTDSSISPLLLAWLIAAILRIALGSATVAALTTAGL